MTKRLALALALLLGAGALASAKPAKRRAPAHHAAPSHAPAPSHTQEHAVTPAPPITTTASAGDGASDEGESAAPAGEAKAGGKTLKTKTYTFGAMDVEGKLKTPQLLYFLNRVQLELDMSAPDKRSFMKELAQSADDKSL